MFLNVFELFKELFGTLQQKWLIDTSELYNRIVLTSDLDLNLAPNSKLVLYGTLAMLPTARFVSYWDADKDELRFRDTKHTSNTTYSERTMRMSGKYKLSDQYIQESKEPITKPNTIPVRQYAPTATVAMQTAQKVILQQGTISGTIERDLQTAVQTSYAEALVLLKTNASLVY